MRTRWMTGWAGIGLALVAATVSLAEQSTPNWHGGPRQSRVDFQAGANPNPTVQAANMDWESVVVHQGRILTAPNNITSINLTATLHVHSGGTLDSANTTSLSTAGDLTVEANGTISLPAVTNLSTNTSRNSYAGLAVRGQFTAPNAVLTAYQSVGIGDQYAPSNGTLTLSGGPTVRLVASCAARSAEERQHAIRCQHRCERSRGCSN